ncbi:MAG TPA: DUF6797 domain-containing protein, partial [Gemmataceae bacterium]|nr:DUF6797 domain-containing protein [Gemmataceae bacterium]
EMLLYMSVWTGGFIKYEGVVFDGAHGPNPSPVGKVQFTTKPTPGWAKDGNLNDPRPKDMAFGPLPRDWARYKGLYRHDGGVVFEYTVGGASILDMPAFETQDGQTFFCRTLHIEPGKGVPQQLVVADLDPTSIKDGTNVVNLLASKGGEDVWIGFGGAPPKTHLEIRGGRVLLHIPAIEGRKAAQIKIGQWTGKSENSAKAQQAFAKISNPLNVTAFTKGGKARFTETVTTKGTRGADNKGAYTIDSVGIPFTNPYKSWMRFGGVDFFSDGRAAISTWSGDVWIVSGLDDGLENVKWKRFTAGLFQPLGVKIIKDVVHVLCRDGVYKLHDLNGDGEADHIECFNNDVLVTSNFHEFIFDLQTDKDGNFYFIKGGPVKPGGRGWDKITPNHGSLFKLDSTGTKLEVIARGFRAPNGISVGPNGEITTGDNEGTWTPTSPINWIKPGGFYGVVDFAQRTPAPTIRDNPLCWLPKENPPHGQYDNSSGGQVWITGSKFGPLSGQLLHTSYGTCRLFNVLKEEVGGQMQGGVVEVLKFDSGVCRARFVEKQNALYLVALRGWQTTATKDAGFYRVRYTGKPANIPVGLHVEPDKMQLTFSDPLSKKEAEDLGNYNAECWYYKWTSNYGSPHFKPSNNKEGHDTVTIKSATLSADGKTVTLSVPGLKPVMQMRVEYKLKMADGTSVRSMVLNTINVLGNERLEVHVGAQKVVPK